MNNVGWARDPYFGLGSGEYVGAGGGRYIGADGGASRSAVGGTTIGAGGGMSIGAGGGLSIGSGGGLSLAEVAACRLARGASQTARGPAGLEARVAVPRSAPVTILTGAMCPRGLADFPRLGEKDSADTITRARHIAA